MTIKSGLKQAINNNFILSVVGFVLVIYISSFESILEALRNNELLMNGFHAEFILKALTSDAIILIVPIVCSIPFASSFIDEIKSGFIKPYLHRTNVGSYIAGKILGCILSGGLVLIFGILAAYLISYLVFTPFEKALLREETPQPYLAEILKYALLFFVSGAFWSLVGMTFAAFTNSKYMAYASPFIIYYILIILNERYFKVYTVYPKEWLNPSQFWVLGNTGVIILLLELILIVSVCFSSVAKRRIADV